MTFLDLFSGIGGFHSGMELAGHTCVGFCEFDKFATASYTSMYLITDGQREYLETLPLKQRQKEILKEEYRNGLWYANDIRSVEAGDIPRADIWCFGAPCQSFSIAGKREGLDGESGLVREVFRILRNIKEEDRPEWLIYENVKGMLSSTKGFDYLAILLEMDEGGYDVEWDTLNTADYLPQNRERIYTVGHLRSRGSRKVFPLKRTDGENNIRQIGKISSEKRDNPNQYRVYDPNGLSPCLNKMEGGGREPHIPVKFIDLTFGGAKITDSARTIQFGNENIYLPGSNYNERKTVHSIGGTCRTLISSKHSGNEPKIAIPVLTPERANKRQNGRRFKENGEPMFTLTTQDRQGIAVEIPIKEAVQCGYSMAKIGDSINLDRLGSTTRRGEIGHGVANTLDTSCNQGIMVQFADNCTAYAIWYKKYQCYIAIRRLTPKECFRLQGFTDKQFEKAQFINSDSQLYKQAGNAVSVPVVADVARKLY